MSLIDSPFLEVAGLHKSFDDRTVLESVTLGVARGSIVSIIGRSGAGKSVFLKCLAGLLTPDSGEIAYEGEPLTAASAARAKFRQRSRYLFQNNALLDSLTALENVMLPLEQKTALPPREISRRAQASLHRLGLKNFEHYYPAQVSGGMQKRIALARALVTEPELVLFDEPTAGLDPLGRNAVFELIARSRREFGFTAIVVTHDVVEALAVSDSVALLDGGRMRFQGTPAAFNASDDAAVMAVRHSQAALLARLDEIEQTYSDAGARVC